MPERWMYDEGVTVLHIFGMTGRTFDPYGSARFCSLAPVVSLQMPQNIFECPYIILESEQWMWLHLFGMMQL